MLVKLTFEVVGFKDYASPSAIGSGYNKLSTMFSMWTPSFTCTPFAIVFGLGAFVAHSSLKSSLGLGPFQTRNLGCRPNWIK